MHGFMAILIYFGSNAYEKHVGSGGGGGDVIVVVLVAISSTKCFLIANLLPFTVSFTHYFVYSSHGRTHFSSKFDEANTSSI